MSFSELAQVENPGPRELRSFVDEVCNFLKYIISDSGELNFLWGDNTRLRELAMESLDADIIGKSAKSLLDAIKETSEQRLDDHGLMGRPLFFKFQVIAIIESGREAALAGEPMPDIPVPRNWRKWFTVRGWFKKMVDAIDAVLDSLIAATGSGGAIKEFKDALRALA